MKGRLGFTFMEILMSMLVFTISILALIGLYVTVAQLNESSRNLMQAVNDARAVLEAVREDSNSGLNTVMAKNWTSWSATNGLTSLRSEAVAVRWPGWPAISTSDPLPVTCTVSWEERTRNRSITVDTLVTRR